MREKKGIGYPAIKMKKKKTTAKRKRSRHTSVCGVSGKGRQKRAFAGGRTERREKSCYRSVQDLIQDGVSRMGNITELQFGAQNCVIGACRMTAPARRGEAEKNKEQKKVFCDHLPVITPSPRAELEKRKDNKKGGGGTTHIIWVT